MYLARLLWYLTQLTLYNLYALLRFFSKPGSRVLMPVVALAVALLMEREWLHSQLDAWISAHDPRPPDALFMDVLIVIIWTVCAALYQVLSRSLAVLLGAFPPLVRPLPPQRRLKTTKKAHKPVVVREVVPPLPKPRAVRAQRARMVEPEAGRAAAE